MLSDEMQSTQQATRWPQQEPELRYTRQMGCYGVGLSYGTLMGLLLAHKYSNTWIFQEEGHSTTAAASYRPQAAETDQEGRKG